MEIEDQLLVHLRDRNVFVGKGAAAGIAQLGIDQGYASLSEGQRSVLEPYMTLPCDGVEDPGGHHNECATQLFDDELLTALSDEGYYEALLCAECRTNHFEWYEQ
ncbi:TPA: hypothetical protein ACKPZ3_003378 [Serratia marcescens]